MEDALLGEKTIAFSIAQEILTTNLKIPSLPANGKKILSMMRLPDDQIDVPEFVKLVESDPGLFVRILSLANSQYYSEVEKIVSLRAAITRVGLTEIVNTVSLYFFQKLLPRFPDIPGFSYHHFWAHSWACAVASRRLGHPNLEMGVVPGELYMAGMLQGMGKLLLAIHYPKRFSRCIHQARELEQPLERIENEVFGTTDSLIASKVLTSWEMPANICQAIAYCRRPELAPPEHIIIAGLTEFAYAIVETTGVGRSGDGAKQLVSQTCFGKRPKLKIGQPDIQEKLVQEIHASIKDKARSFTSTPSKRKAKSNTEPANKYTDSQTKAKKAPKKKGVISWVKSLWK